MDLKHTARFTVMHRIEKQKTFSQGTAIGTDLSADAVQMFRFLSGLLTEVAAGMKKMHTAEGNKYLVVQN